MTGWVQVEANPANQVLFQKEPLLNVAEKIVPVEFKKVVIVDADLHFSNPNWLQETSVLLNHFTFVQPFETAIWTEADGTESFKKPATLRMKGGLPNKSHPGFAMACKRSTWNNIGGLYNHMVVGSGDMALAVAVLDSQIPPSQTYSVALKKHFETWRTRVAEETKGSVAWTTGSVWHEWHGDRVLRKYHERHKVSERLNPNLHLKMADNGLITWTSKAPKDLKKYVHQYFENRQEDTPNASATSDR